jgi:S-(hydroxymethyl)glutathione dehydrogenase / alcohol dehydrogenase
MKAAVLTKVPEPLEMKDLQIDKPGPGEVLITTAASGVCHSDLHFVEGKYPARVPMLLGHEAAGVVEAVGPDVTYLQPGDHVITCLSIFCGLCDYCLSGRPHLCGSPPGGRAQDAPPRLTLDGTPVNAFTNLGSFAEQMLVHQNATVKITKDIGLDHAALIGCGVTTGVGAVFNTAKVHPMATVAVIGCGGVGLNCVQGAAIAGAGRIIAVDMNETKLKLAEQFGATDLVNASKGDAVQQVMELTKGGVEFAFEAIGLKQTSEEAFNMLRRGGTATIIGMIPFGTKIELDGFQFLGEKKIQGSTMGSNRFRHDMPKLIDLYLQGRLKLDELVSARIPLEEVNDAFDAMRAGEVARSVIVF